MSNYFMVGDRKNLALKSNRINDLGAYFFLQAILIKC